MTVELPIVILALLVHGAVFISSLQTDRVLRAVAAVLVILLILPLQMAPAVPVSGERPLYTLLAIVQERAAYYLPFLSFLVYLRGSRKK
ncbi:MAG: hypothetical protein WD601_07090 [Pseudohongiellaceae bacterium]